MKEEEGGIFTFNFECFVVAVFLGGGVVGGSFKIFRGPLLVFVFSVHAIANDVFSILKV